MICINKRIKNRLLFFLCYNLYGDFMENYICKIATLDEMNTKWDYEINRATDDKDNYLKWRVQHINRFLEGKTIPYYGLLNGKIICEATAALDPMLNINTTLLINDKSVYILAVRTVDEYQGKGYFRELFKYMINDLKSRGYKYATIGVEKNNKIAKDIYLRYGFTEYLKDSVEYYPDGTKVELEYYRKEL